MSVTFHAEITSAVDTRTFAVTCEDGTKIGDYVGYSNAYGEAQAHSLVCTRDLCRDYGAGVDPIEDAQHPASVNVSNRNAADILRVIGLCAPIGEQQYGEQDARKFLDLVTAALAVGVTDNGLDTIETRGGGLLAGDYRLIDCGREPGYLIRRLRELRDLAEKCARLNVKIVWS